MRGRVALSLALALMLGTSVQLGAQGVSFDFEHGLRGWHASGSAFSGQPIKAADVLTDAVARVTIGGDYWRGLTYPIGHQRQYMIRTSDTARGSLVSDERSLGGADRFFSVLVGGTDAMAQRIELQVHSAPFGAVGTAAGSFATVFQVTGGGGEGLRRAVFVIPSNLQGRLARVLIVDDSATGRITVDDVRFSREAPAPQAEPVWGLGDFHAHPMTHMAFGALNGVRAVWGVPGGAITEYDARPDLVARDIPRCEAGHRGGHSAEVFINSAEGRFVPRGVFKDLWTLLSGRLTGHRREGGPGFESFPSLKSGAHQQMHITQIHRAWAGGLRLMVAIAVHNVGVEFLTAKLQNDKVDPSTERDVLAAQVCGMRQLAGLNANWMEIAYDARQARDIIANGKLAIVLGVEMDQLGALGAWSIDEEVAHLWDLGVRQVTPIHAIDNTLGGAAVFQPVYNSLNDLLGRGAINLSPKDLAAHRPASFFAVEERGCGAVTAPPLGECVEFALDPKQQRAVITRTPMSLFRRAPFIVPEHVPGYVGMRGMANRRGLEPKGHSYLRALMSRGMLIGLEHMSRRSVEDVTRTVAEWLLERGHGECGGFGSQETPGACDEAAYPLNVTHAHFRRVSLPREKTTVAGFRASEYEVGDLQSDIIRRTGGFVGQFVSEDPVILPNTSEPLPFKNDCAGSSKSFATSTWYALQRLDWTGVGVATDFTFIPGASPRFGTHACSADVGAQDRRKERALAPEQYDAGAQTNPVRYTTSTVATGARIGANDPIVPYRMGNRVYDFNLDGFAHYGLLPDLLQDVRNIGLPRRALESLFSSAESYLRTWEKAERVAAVGSTQPFKPKGLDCAVACRGLCPKDPNAGAPQTR